MPALHATIADIFAASTERWVPVTPPGERWTAAHLDRRSLERAEYRRTSPALLELDGLRCAVRDLGLGGLRVEPAPGAASGAWISR